MAARYFLFNYHIAVTIGGYYIYNRLEGHLGSEMQQCERCKGISDITPDDQRQFHTSLLPLLKETTLRQDS